jgi:hypothetical protein
MESVQTRLANHGVWILGTAYTFDDHHTSMNRIPNARERDPGWFMVFNGVAAAFLHKGRSGSFFVGG